jgi:hypothetical protein
VSNLRHWRPSHIYSYRVICNNNIIDVQSCEVGTTLAGRRASKNTQLFFPFFIFFLFFLHKVEQQRGDCIYLPVGLIAVIDELFELGM